MFNILFAALCVSTGLHQVLRFQSQGEIQKFETKFCKLGQQSEPKLSLTWTKIGTKINTLPSSTQNQVHLLFAGILADGSPGCKLGLGQY